MSLLSVSGLSRSFGGIKALDDISFDLAPGELLALIGPNGAGKSTTFNIVNGQLTADGGSIRLEGKEMLGSKPRDIWRLGVGRTFQIADTFSSLTVVENVQMALLSFDRRLLSMWSRARNHRREDALELLDQVGMAAQADRPCSVLAYGDVKRVELAMALANKPRLLLMDEPTAGMAPKERHSLMALTRKLVQDHNVAVLFTEHSMDVVFAHADRLLVLARGKLIAEGKAEEIRAHPKVQEVYFGTGKTFEAQPRTAASGLDSPVGDQDRNQVLSQAEHAYSRVAGDNGHAASHAAEVLLEAQGLSAWYGAAQILFDVEFSIGRGEVVALMGRNGAGKSTTLKTLMGMIAKRRGSISFMGRDISGYAPYQASSLGLGFVPEDRRIFTDLTVLENLNVGRQPVRRWPDGTNAPSWTVPRIFALFPNLAQMAQRPGGRMSGGEQQMLTVGRTLMGNPYLVLLDEPSEGVAPLIVEQMAQMILALKSQGVSVLLCEQNTHFAELVSDRAYVLEKGQIRYKGSMSDLAANQEVRSAYLSV